MGGVILWGSYLKSGLMNIGSEKFLGLTPGSREYLERTGL